MEGTGITYFSYFFYLKVGSVLGSFLSLFNHYDISFNLNKNII